MLMYSNTEWPPVSATLRSSERAGRHMHTRLAFFVSVWRLPISTTVNTTIPSRAESFDGASIGES